MIIFKEKNTTVNGTFYIPFLRKLQKNIQEKRCCICPYLWHCIKYHFPTNKSHSSSEYYLFDYFKKNLRERHFWDNIELQKAVLTLFDDKPKNYFFLQGLNYELNYVRRALSLRKIILKKNVLCFFHCQTGDFWRSPGGVIVLFFSSYILRVLFVEILSRY